MVSTAAFHARVRSRSRRFERNKKCVKVSIVGSLRDREVAFSASDRQGSNFESCVWRTVSSHHPQEVLLAKFILYVYKSGLKPDSFPCMRVGVQEDCCFVIPHACVPMTPIARPTTDNERCHIMTRNIIGLKRFFGVLKRRFACLHFGLRIKLSTSLILIVACCVLHNIARRTREVDNVDVELDDDHDNAVMTSLIQICCHPSTQEAILSSSV